MKNWFNVFLLIATVVGLSYAVGEGIEQRDLSQRYQHFGSRSWVPESFRRGRTAGHCVEGRRPQPFPVASLHPRQTSNEGEYFRRGKVR